MDQFKLNQLRELAMCEAVERISDVTNSISSMAVQEINSLHIAAYMDIEKTTKSLNSILAYKKQAASQMLQCSDQEQMNYIAHAITEADNMIKKVLGVYEIKKRAGD